MQRTVFHLALWHGSHRPDSRGLCYNSTEEAWLWDCHEVNMETVSQLWQYQEHASSAILALLRGRATVTVFSPSQSIAASWTQR